MDKPFDRVTFGFREKPVSTDWNRMQSQADRTLRDVLLACLSGRASDSSYAPGARSGFMPVAFKVVGSAPAAMTVQVAPGFGYHYLPSDAPTDIGSPDLLGVDDLGAWKPVVMLAASTFAVPTSPPAVNTRIDIIEVRADRFLDDSESRRQLQSTGNFDPHNFYKTLSFVLDGRVGSVTSPADSTEPLSYKIGVEANPGVAPSTTSGYIKLAEIHVGTAVTTIGDGDIVDNRKLLAYGGTIRGAARFRVQWNAGTPIVTLRSAALPPDVQVAAIPWPVGAAQRAALRFYLLAGQPTEVALTAQVTRYTGTPSNSQAFLTVLGPILSAVDYLQTVDATIKANMAAATPALAACVGQQVITFDVEGRFAANTGTLNATDALLEDVEIQANLSIAYH